MAAPERMAGREDLNDQPEVKSQDLEMDQPWAVKGKDWKVTLSSVVQARLTKPNLRVSQGDSEAMN